MSDQRLPQPPLTENGYIRRLYQRLVEVFRAQRPAAGWKDLTADLGAAKTGGGAGTAPSWSAINSTGVYGWSFVAGADRELWINFHIPHDIAFSLTREDGTVQGMTLYPHVHWLSDGTNTGTVRFGIEYIYAKGYAAGTFGSSTTIYLEQASDGTAWKHNIVETTDANALTNADFETDGLLLCRLFRNGAHANDTLTDDVIVPFMDLHYYSDGMETNERNRDSTGVVAWTKRLMNL